MQDQLYPFTWTRSISSIRIGILTLEEKWRALFPEGRPAGIADNVIPDQALARTISGQVNLTTDTTDGAKPITGGGPASDQLRILEYPWQIIQFNEAALIDDFELITRGRRSQPIPDTVQTIHPERIFIEEGASVQFSMLNASTGPIYIGRNAVIMEGSLIRGPFAAGEHAVIKMGAKIYGATTIGPHCTAGGEIKNSILSAYSNKAHDGYLGDSVIGEWCNLGAGVSNSNLKNSAGIVKVWHQPSQAFIPAGLKCGLLMGDYSRAAINTSFNTGTVVGPSCNVFGEGLTPKHIPAFTWGLPGGPKYRLEAAIQDIGNWKKFKNQALTETEIRTLETIFTYH